MSRAPSGRTWATIQSQFRWSGFDSVMSAKEKTTSKGFAAEPGHSGESSMPFYDVCDFGAKPDGQTLCTKSIQAAIDACHEGGGGFVIFPKGEFLTGTIEIKANVYLNLMPDSTILGSTNIDDYVYQGLKPDEPRPAPEGESAPVYLIYANGASRMGIIGTGTINGQGDSFWRGKQRPFIRPERTVKCINCEDVLFRDFDLINSASWCIDVECCNRVTVTRLRIINERESLNTDGIDPVSSTNVFISDCYIDTGDDAICPKSRGPNDPVENLVVTNCVLITRNSAIKLGTGSHGPIRNCAFSNIVIRNSRYGIGFYMKHGGSFEDIQFSNISIETVVPSDAETVSRTDSFAIFMDLESINENTPLGSIRNIMFSDINIISTDGNCLFSGMAEQLIENITLSNVRMRVRNRTDLGGRRKPRGTRSLQDVATNDRAGIQSYFAFVNIKNLNIHNLAIEDDTPHRNHESYCLWGENIHDATITGFKNRQLHHNRSRSLLWFKDVKGMHVSGCQPLSPDTPFLALEGSDTTEITLMGNVFSKVADPIEQSSEVDSSQIYASYNKDPNT